MYISIALELPRLVSDEWRQVVTWALSVGAERRLQCGDVEYRAPSATKPDVRFMCLPDVGTTLAVGCALWYPRTCVVSVDLDPRLEPMLTRVHLRILMILDVHQYSSRTPRQVSDVVRPVVTRAETAGVCPSVRADDENNPHENSDVP